MGPLAKAKMATEIAVAYTQARWLMRRRPLPATLKALRPRTEGATGSADAVPAAIQLGRTTVKLLEALPTDSRCLIRSLTLSRLLDRRGIPSVLVIGTKSGESFGAHAWVEIAGHPVLDPGGGEFPRLVEL